MENDTNFMDEHVLIVGASSQIALSAIKYFANENYRLSLVCRTEPQFPENFKKDACAFFQFDLENIDTIPILFREIIEKNGEVTRICFFQRYRGNGDSWEGENKVSIQATQKFVELFQSYSSMREDRSIVIVTSPADTEILKEQPLSYHMGKACLSQMIKYYACFPGTSKIRVNGVRPAIVMKERAREYYENHPELVHLFHTIIPLGRMGTPEDITNAIFFLSSEKSSFITGHIITVDGGLSLHENASLARFVSGK